MAASGDPQKNNLPRTRKIAPNKVLPWAGAFLFIVIMFFASSQSGDASHANSRSISAELFRMLKPIVDIVRENQDEALIAYLNNPVRKAAHVIIYFFITLFVILGMRGITNKKICIFATSFLVVFALACLNEIHQVFTDGRYASALDVALNMVGAVFAYLAALLHMLIRKIVALVSKSAPDD